MVRFSDLLGGGAGHGNGEQADTSPAPEGSGQSAPAANDPYAELATLGGDPAPVAPVAVNDDAAQQLTPEQILARLVEYADSVRAVSGDGPQDDGSMEAPGDTDPLPPPPPPPADYAAALRTINIETPSPEPAANLDVRGVGTDDLLPSSREGRRKSR